MGFDIRIPIGFLFTTLGLADPLWSVHDPIANLLAFARHEYQLEWGIILLIFGLLMVFFAKRSERRTAAQQTSRAKGVN